MAEGSMPLLGGGLLLRPLPGSLRGGLQSAKTLGLLAITLAVVALICTALNTFAAPGENGDLIVIIGVVAIFLVHILAIISSQTLARWRFSHGLVAVILWWGGLLGIIVLVIAMRGITALLTGT